MRVYASPAYLSARGRPRRPEDLADHNCLVMTSQNQPMTWHFRPRRGRKLVVVAVRGRVAVNSFVLLRDLAAAGQGMTRLPDFLGAPAVAAGTLLTVLDDFAPPAHQWYAVYPSARNLSPKVRVLIGLLEERFSAVFAPPPNRSR